MPLHQRVASGHHPVTPPVNSGRQNDALRPTGADTACAWCPAPLQGPTREALTRISSHEYAGADVSCDVRNCVLRQDSI